MRNVDLWDINTQFVLHREPSQLMILRFEVFTSVTMKNAVFWDIKTQFVPHRRHVVSATEPSR
jgi:hypothetical protein